MKRLGRLMPLLIASAILSACTIISPINLQRKKTMEPDAMRNVKKVAIMPFFYANAVGADDPGYKGKWSDMMPTINVYEGVKGGGSYNFIPMDDVIAALKKRGFKGVDMAPGEEATMMKMITQPDRFRVGLTMKQALDAGKELGADAVLIGSFGLYGNAPANMRYVMAMRLVRPDGKVLWGGAQSEKMQASLFSPFETQKKQMRALASKLLAEAK